MASPVSYRGKTRLPAAFALATCLLTALAAGQAQDQNAPPTASASFSGTDENLPPDRLQALVAPVALYPDDLLAIVLPASTQPLQLVAAQRLLDQRKTDPKVEPPKSWDPSVVGLLNYPEVVALMNHDLTWTQQLGTSVINQQSALMEAIQSFRQKVQSAGNLKSDDKHTVTVEKETIIIQSANPQVIYVPTYNPTAVIYAPAPGYPPPYYYSAPYPYYYSPAATFATGVVVGASIGYALSWNNRGIYYGNVNNNNINVNRNTNINAGNTNINANRSSFNQSNINNQTANLTRNGENAWHPDSNSVKRSQSVSGGNTAARSAVTSSQISSGLAQAGQQAGAGPRQIPSTQNLAARNPSAGNAPPGGAGNRQAKANPPTIAPRAGNPTTANRSSSALSGAGNAAATNTASARGNQSLGQSNFQGRAGGGTPSRGGGGGGGGGRR
jgi:hypothetical protein